MGGSNTSSFDEPLQEVLRDHVARDTIRSVLIQGPYLGHATLLASVISSLTPDCEDVQRSSIKSISLGDVDVSNFFARYHFPKLRDLHLSGRAKISSWKHFRLRTTALTTLSLTIRGSSPTPTTSQLLLILASNPRLRSLALSPLMVPHDNGDGFTSRVPLYHLRDLSLGGNFRAVFQLLRRLDHPETMDESIKLSFSNCTVEDTSEILGPYMRDYFLRDRKSRDQLGLFVSAFRDWVTVEANVISTDKGPVPRVAFARFDVELMDNLPHLADEVCIDLVACTPREHVVYFEGDLSMDAVREIVPAMPKIQELRLNDALLSDRFLQPDPYRPLANKKLFPSLQRLHLDCITPEEEDDWTPLLLYLAHQTSGGQAISLSLSGDPIHICKGVMREVEGLVEVILDLTSDEYCPFGFCSVDDGEVIREEG
jgi:hypothetical protein